MTTMSFLLDLERVIIMENGGIKEHGRPHKLLTNKQTELYKEVNEVDPNVIKQFNKKVLLGGKKWKKGTKGGQNPILSILGASKKKK